MREPAVFVKMPMLLPVLESVDDFQPLCGDVEYTFYDNNLSTPPGAAPLVLSVSTAPADNSDAV